MSVAKRVADEMDGMKLSDMNVIFALTIFASSPRQTSRLLNPFRRHDGARDHFLEVHDGRYASP